jgi:hypothetical protein
MSESDIYLAFEESAVDQPVVTQVYNSFSKNIEFCYELNAFDSNGLDVVIYLA